MESDRGIVTKTDHHPAAHAPGACDAMAAPLNLDHSDHDHPFDSHPARNGVADAAKLSGATAAEASDSASGVPSTRSTAAPGATDGATSFDPVAHREALMTEMVRWSEVQEVVSGLMQSIRSGESFAVHAAHERAVALAIRVGQGARRLLELVRRCRQDEEAMDRALRINHPTRRDPSNSRPPNPAVADAALATAIQDGHESYPGATNPLPLASWGQGDNTHEIRAEDIIEAPHRTPITTARAG